MILSAIHCALYASVRLTEAFLLHSVHNGDMSDTVQQVKDRLGIVDVVSGYVKLERAGQNMRARCPFHAEKSPSFIVSPDRGTYHCFGCGVGGDIFSFIEAIEGVDFKGALKILADKAGVELVYSRGEKKDDTDRLFEAMEAATLFYQARLDESALKYLKGRGLTDDTIRAFRLGFAGDGWSELSDYLKEKKFSEKELIDAGLSKKGERGGLNDKFRNRIMFPLADTAGRVVAFSGRTFGEKAHPDAPKYLNSPETPLFHKSRILYGFDRAKQLIRKHNFAVLVEGQMDLISSHQAGWANTVAVSGTAFTSEHAQLIRRMTENLVIALDPDEAGFKAASRAARAALAQGMQVKVAQLPVGLDPADLILKEGAERWRSVVREAKDIITFLLDVLEKTSKTKEGFRRAVEIAVLPFLHDVPSPIAREQYQVEIATRLGVSMNAVAEAFQKMVKPPEPPQVKKVLQPSEIPNRIKQAYGILIWQDSQKKPDIDIDAYSGALEEAIGLEQMDMLRTLPVDEKERLRFLAQKMHGESTNLKRTVETVVPILKRDRLQKELDATTTALREAEEKGDERAVEKLVLQGKLLHDAIAKMT